jgi:hypothetical protein
MITFKEFMELNPPLNLILEDLDPQESTLVQKLKTIATDIINNIKISLKIPDEKTLNTQVPKLLNQLKNKYGKYANEDYDLSLLSGFNFFNQIDHLKEFWSSVGKAILKAIVAIIKWLFTSLANLIKASLNMIKDSFSEEGFFKLCVFWVAPAILASPVLGLQAIYGINNLIGLTPFIAWVIWHVFVAPALVKLDAK